MSTAEMTPEMETLKSRLKATWMAGDFGVIARIAGALHERREAVHDA